MGTSFLFYCIAYFYPFYFLFLFGLFVFFLGRSIPVIKQVFLKITKQQYVVLFAITIVGLFFRCRYTIHTDLDFYCWEYIKNALAVAKILGVPTRWDFALGDTHYIPGYSVLISPLVIFNRLELVSYANIFISTCTIGVVYGITYVITKKTLPAFLSALFLALSSSHIILSGYEFAYGCAVLIVALEWFFFLLWIETRDDRSGWVFLSLLLLSLNIKKAENVVFIPAFIFIYFRQDLKSLYGSSIRKHFKLFILAVVVSLFFFLPFLCHLAISEISMFKEYLSGPPSLFSPMHLFNNCMRIFVEEGRWPLLVFSLSGYFSLLLLKIENKGMRLIFWWLFFSLGYFFYYDYASARWSVLQVLIPLFILQAYVCAEMLQIFARDVRFRRFLFILFISIPLLASFLTLNKPLGGFSIATPYTWREIKTRIDMIPADACLVSQDMWRLSLSMEFLFPKRKLIFLRNLNSFEALSKCKGAIYYFDPVPYGLSEELIPHFRVMRSKIEADLHRQYKFDYIGDGILLYKLTSWVNYDELKVRRVISYKLGAR